MKLTNLINEVEINKRQVNRLENDIAKIIYSSKKAKEFEEVSVKVISDKSTMDNHHIQYKVSVWKKGMSTSFDGFNNDKIIWIHAHKPMKSSKDFKSFGLGAEQYSFSIDAGTHKNPFSIQPKNSGSEGYATFDEMKKELLSSLKKNVDKFLEVSIGTNESINENAFAVIEKNIWRAIQLSKYADGNDYLQKTLFDKVKNSLIGNKHIVSKISNIKTKLGKGLGDITITAEVDIVLPDSGEKGKKNYKYIQRNSKYKAVIESVNDGSMRESKPPKGVNLSIVDKEIKRRGKANMLKHFKDIKKNKLYTKVNTPKSIDYLINYVSNFNESVNEVNYKVGDTITVIRKDGMKYKGKVEKLNPLKLRTDSTSTVVLPNPMIKKVVIESVNESVYVDESQLGIFTTTIDSKVHNANDAWGIFLRDYARNKGVSDKELGKMSLSDMNLKYGDKAKKEFNLKGSKFIDFVRQLVKQGQIELVKEDVEMMNESVNEVNYKVGDTITVIRKDGMKYKGKVEKLNPLKLRTDSTSTVVLPNPMIKKVVIESVNESTENFIGFALVKKNGMVKDLDSLEKEPIYVRDILPIYRKEGGSYVVKSSMTGNALKVPAANLKVKMKDEYEPDVWNKLIAKVTRY